MKATFLVLILLTIIFALTAINAYAHQVDYYNRDDVKVEVKKIDKGLQITIASDDPEVAKEIQEDTRWYKKMVTMGYSWPMMNREDMMDMCPMMGKTR